MLLSAYATVATIAAVAVAALQVYTYTLNPLIAGEEADSSTQQQQQQRDLPRQARPQQQQGNQSSVSGWELRLVMEFCDQVRGAAGLASALKPVLLLLDCCEATQQVSPCKH
jgi:hypothetical protein